MHNGSQLLRGPRHRCGGRVGVPARTQVRAGLLRAHGLGETLSTTTGWALIVLGALAVTSFACSVAAYDRRGTFWFFVAGCTLSIAMIFVLVRELVLWVMQ